MKNLVIAVGTASKQKINYLKDVLKDLKIKAKIVSVETKSGVSEQPKTSEETERGAVNRAKSAFEKASQVDFSVGIEVGYHKNNESGYEMFC